MTKTTKHRQTRRKEQVERKIKKERERTHSLLQTLLTSIIGMLELERAGLASIKENDGEMEKRMKEKKRGIIIIRSRG
jgi:hypothetical protein